MLKSARSPVRGYNHNVKYRGRVFHVQTEESGPGNPRIFTHLYFGGTILASKRHEYDPAAAPDIVRGLMQSQHKSILRDLKSGRHDAQLLQFFTARGEVLEPAAVANAPTDDEFPDEAQTPAPAVIAAAALAPPVPPQLPAPVPPIAPVAAHAPVAAAPAPAARVAAPVQGRLQFPEAETGNPTSFAPTSAPTSFAPVSAADDASNPEHQRLAEAAAEARSNKGTPALGSMVRMERIVNLGKTPTPVVMARARRPAPSIPYVVQEGSHPVQEGAAATPPPESQPLVTAPIAPAPNAVTVPTPVPQIGVPIKFAPVAATAATPPPPPVPLAPEASTPLNAPLTAAMVGATPETAVNREDSQSLDEVIMAYLSRGVDRDVGNVG